MGSEEYSSLLVGIRGSIKKETYEGGIWNCKRSFQKQGGSKGGHGNREEEGGKGVDKETQQNSCRPMKGGKKGPGWGRSSKKTLVKDCS